MNSHWNKHRRRWDGAQRKGGRGARGQGDSNSWLKLEFTAPRPLPDDSKGRHPNKGMNPFGDFHKATLRIRV